MRRRKARKLDRRIRHAQMEMRRVRHAQMEMVDCFVEWMDARPYPQEPPTVGFYVENCEKHGGWTHLVGETWEHQDELADQLEQRDDLFLSRGLYVDEMQSFGLPIKPVVVVHELEEVK